MANDYYLPDDSYRQQQEMEEQEYYLWLEDQNAQEEYQQYLVNEGNKNGQQRDIQSTEAPF